MKPIKTKTWMGLPKTDAQDAVIAAIVGATLAARDRHDANLARAIEILGAGIAKKYGVDRVPGLPDTFKSEG